MGKVSKLPDEELSHALSISNQEFPCHLDDLYGAGETSCRGHWEACQLAKKKGLPPVELPEDYFLNDYEP
jgi:hypothetical protein